MPCYCRPGPFPQRPAETFEGEIVASARTEVKGASLRSALLLRKSYALDFSPRYGGQRASKVNSGEARAIVLRLLNVLTAVIRRPI